MPGTKTAGELAFEAYLTSQGLTNFLFEKAHEGKNKKPDYTLVVGQEYLFDVKDFEPSPTEADGAYDPYRRIRQKIDDAREKFREFKGWPCCLVLFNAGASGIHLDLPEIMIGSMEGNAGFTVPIGVPTTASLNQRTNVFAGGGKMIRPGWSQPHNTRISALISLRHIRVSQGVRSGKLVQGTSALGVIVWENRFASTEFPRTMFCGPYDERWGVEGDVITHVFAGTEISRSEGRGA